MKKLILYLSVLMIVFISLTDRMEAQVASTLPIIAGDTVSTSTSLDTVSKVITVSAGYSALGIQVEGTKTTGTITAKAYLYSSLDGTTYNLTDSSAAFANSAGTQAVWFTKTGGLPYVYYKIQVRPPGASASTEGLAIRIRYVLRKFD